MKKSIDEIFKEYINSLSDKKKEKLELYFKQFNDCCLIEEKKEIEIDLKRAIIFYKNNKKNLEEILELLDLKYFGDFYSDLCKKRFELYEIAKTYSFSISYDFMLMFRLSVYLKEEIVPELLQMALNFTIKRFPTFAVVLKKGFFGTILNLPSVVFI